ncbi:MAG TPA: hypothetical protein VLG50_00735, partial [Candidatus Saccharimonadales bacterium]|nr:hypothetical protein [Candidatus Saccharimonadales bacterium]
MAKLVLKNNHIIFTSGNDIAQICTPLKKFGIISFNYVRTYDDGSQVNLANTTEWLKYFYDNEFYQVGAFERHPSK